MWELSVCLIVNTRPPESTEQEILVCRSSDDSRKLNGRLRFGPTTDKGGVPFSLRMNAIQLYSTDIRSVDRGLQLD